MTKLIEMTSPDWVSAPGETMSDRLDELGWKQNELAERLGYTTKHVSQLIHGNAAITEDTALRLERVLGGTARFWLEREAQYREAQARKEDLEALSEKKDWLTELPLSEMVRLGWVRRLSHKGQQVEECLRFFSVANIQAWRSRYSQQAATAFRASPSFEKKPAAVGAWLRRTEQLASDIECAPFRKAGFRKRLTEIRSLTSEEEPENFLPALIETCQEVGVAVVFQEAPKGCPVSGAARWLDADKAMIALSLRHKTNDHLWFSFFHEAAHILLHSKKLDFVDVEGGLDDDLEDEADAFARDQLIPPSAFREIVKVTLTEDSIGAFAREIGIAPGIVVGRLQKEGFLRWNSQLNRLKVRYTWSRKTA